MNTFFCNPKIYWCIKLPVNSLFYGIAFWAQNPEPRILRRPSRILFLADSSLFSGISAPQGCKLLADFQRSENCWFFFHSLWGRDSVFEASAFILFLASLVILLSPIESDRGRGCCLRRLSWGPGPELLGRASYGWHCFNQTNFTSDSCNFVSPGSDLFTDPSASHQPGYLWLLQAFSGFRSWLPSINSSSESTNILYWLMLTNLFFRKDHTLCHTLLRP